LNLPCAVGVGVEYCGCCWGGAWDAGGVL
jgi:hypothetical protein